MRRSAAARAALQFHGPFGTRGLRGRENGVHRANHSTGVGRRLSSSIVKRFLEELVNAALIATGILSAGMGLKGFLLSSNFIDGGVTGVCMLLAKTTPVSLAVWLPVVNLPFVAIGYRQMGGAFAARSALAIAGLRRRALLHPLSRRHYRSAS